jgi:hypothetical protein
MIKRLNININNGNLKATYSKSNINYIFSIDGFILPKNKNLNEYILNKIIKDEKYNTIN